MQPSPFQQRLIHAQGWLELGNLAEAFAELDELQPELRGHADVLEIRIEVFLKAKQWQSAFEVADTLVRQCPDRLRPWLARSEALHGMGKTLDACRQLALVLGTPISNRWEIKYALAQYSCAEGKSKAAYSFLKEALDSAESRDLYLRALDDPMLEPLWKEIGSLPE